MSDLRLALLGLGIALIAAIWLWSVLARRRGGAPRAAPRRTAGPGRKPPRRAAVAERASRATPSGPRLRRGEPPPLDLAFDESDDEPALPPLGLDAPGTGSSGEDGPPAAPSRAGGGSEDRRVSGPGESASARDSRREPPEPGAERPSVPPLEERRRESPAGALSEQRLEGLRATREAPRQVQIDLLDPREESPPALEEGAEAEVARHDDEPDAETLVVVLTVLAPAGGKIEGEALRAAFESQGLRYGEGRIFHRYPDSAPPGATALFSVVNIVEPGIFDLETIDAIRTPGVGLFMRLPGPKDPGDAFAIMVRDARALAEALDARLCDETRTRLTPQTLNHLREQIADFGRRRLLRV